MVSAEIGQIGAGLEQNLTIAKNIKVIFSHDIFIQQSFGGISRYFTELIKQLIIHHTQVKIEGAFHVNSHLSKVDNLKVRYLPCSMATRAFAYYANQVAKRLAPIDSTGGIYHKTYYSGIPRRRRGKTIITIYDMIHERFPNDFAANDQIANWKRAWCREADHIIAISQSTKRDIVRYYGIPEEKISVVYLAPSLLDKDVKADESLDHIRSPFLLYVGRRDGYKNFWRWLEAFKISWQLSRDLSVVCFGGGRFNSKEKARLRSLGLEKKVYHLSGDDGLLLHCYKQARALVYPSLWEGFGLPLVEAMSVGCPIFTGGEGSCREIAADCAHYFDPYSIDEMKSKMEEILPDGDMLTAHRRAGIERAKCFTWERTAASHLAIYRTALAN
ncbi:MAG: glycosyltransferase family 4 protein [Deltaproteobacteria bacterium]|nr:glycosyltransferase family 4 protein [Deltaproteobacteria bacterium]